MKTKNQIPKTLRKILIVSLMGIILMGFSQSVSADYKMEINSVEEIGTVKVGSTITIDVEVENIGASTLGSDVVAKLYVDGNLKDSKSLSGLKPGYTETVKLEYTPREAKTYKYNVKVKSDSELLDKSIAYYFTAEYGGIGAEITYLKELTEELTVGETAQISVTVKNTGTVTFGSDVVAKLYVDGELEDSKDLDGLEPGDSRTIYLDYKPVKAGTFDYKVKVKDPEGTLARSPAYQLTVKEVVVKPNTAEITYLEELTEELTVGETIQISVTVKNTGTVTFGSDVVAKLYVDGELEDSKGLDGLEPGDSRTIHLEYTSDEAGTFYYKVKVKDPERTLAISPAYQLTVKGVVVEPNTAEITYLEELIEELTVGETIQISVTVKNTGTSIFDSNVKARLYVNGYTQDLKSLSGLKSGDTRTVGLEYTPDQAGTFYYKVKVKDPKGTLAISPAYQLTVKGVVVEPNKAEITYLEELTEELTVGETAQISVTVKNTGTSIFDSNVKARLYVNGYTEDSKSLSGLKSGDTRTVELEYTPDKAGTFYYKVKVKDPKGTLAISPAYQLTVKEGVVEPNKAEIKYVEDIAETVGVVQLGDVVRIGVTVENIGEKVFDDSVNARLYVDGNFQHSKSLRGVKPGSTDTMEFEYKPPEIGTYKYNIKVKDSTNLLDKSDAYIFKVEE